MIYPIVDADHVVFHVFYAAVLQLEHHVGFVALTILMSHNHCNSLIIHII